MLKGDEEMVFITNWSKPKNCYSCHFNDSDCWCRLTKSKIDRDDYTTEEKCPIINVPKENAPSWYVEGEH